MLKSWHEGLQCPQIAGALIFAERYSDRRYSSEYGRIAAREKRYVDHGVDATLTEESARLRHICADARERTFERPAGDANGGREASLRSQLDVLSACRLRARCSLENADLSRIGRSLCGRRIGWGIAGYALVAREADGVDIYGGHRGLPRQLESGKRCRTCEEIREGEEVEGACGVDHFACPTAEKPQEDDHDQNDDDRIFNNLPDHFSIIPCVAFVSVLRAPHPHRSRGFSCRSQCRCWGRCLSLK